MNFGDKIRQLRTEKNLTQPQLAQAIGIEQSYLSKLENDKSVPSAEIFQAILKAFGVDVGTFLVGIDERAVFRDLRQIPEVANLLNANVVARIHSIKKWLYASAAVGIVGLSLFVAGYRGLIFPDRQYSYYSAGVVLPGEPTDIFSNYDMLVQSRWLSGEITNEEHHKRSAEFKTSRVRELYLLLDDYRGLQFVSPAAGGTRTYRFSGQSLNERPENRYLMLFGTLLTFAGIFGFFVEYRLRSVSGSR